MNQEFYMNDEFFSLTFLLGMAVVEEEMHLSILEPLLVGLQDEENQ